MPFHRKLSQCFTLSAHLEPASYDMILAVLSIAILLLSIALFDFGVVQFVMVLPFLVNLYLFANLYLTWRKQGQPSDIHRTSQFRVAIFHLLAWFGVSWLYVLFGSR